MVLTVEEIQLLMELLAQEVVVEPTSEFPYSIVARRSGYHPKHGPLQAKLSMMIEAKLLTASLAKKAAGEPSS